jgi:hypothetical protein
MDELKYAAAIAVGFGIYAAYIQWTHRDFASYQARIAQEQKAMQAKIAQSGLRLDNKLMMERSSRKDSPIKKADQLTLRLELNLIHYHEGVKLEYPLMKKE